MRLATAADEILPLKDPRVQQNPAYLTVILLSRVVTKLGNLSDVHPGLIEGLYASDLSYLQALYQDLNGDGALTAPAVCPKCEHPVSWLVSRGGAAEPHQQTLCDGCLVRVSRRVHADSLPCMSFRRRVVLTW
jgi:hypothetical protein